MPTRKQIEIILKKVALRDGVSVEHVCSEIQAAIDTGLSSPDPGVKAFWWGIPHKGPRPTPEEVLLYLSTKIDGYI